MNQVVQVLVDTYKGNRVRTITTLYKALMDDKSTTGYIKEKWEREFDMEIPDDEWDNMWEKHKTTTCSRVPGESFPGKIVYVFSSLLKYLITTLRKESHVGGIVGHLMLTMHIFSGIVTK